MATNIHFKGQLDQDGCSGCDGGEWVVHAQWGSRIFKGIGKYETLNRNAAGGKEKYKITGYLYDKQVRYAEFEIVGDRNPQSKDFLTPIFYPKFTKIQYQAQIFMSKAINSGNSSEAEIYPVGVSGTAWRVRKK